MSACVGQLAAACGTQPLRLSGVTGLGVREALAAILTAIDEVDAAEAKQLEDPAWQP